MLKFISAQVASPQCLNNAIMRTAFPSLVFAAKKTATKTTNYKAAAYGGVSHPNEYGDIEC